MCAYSVFNTFPVYPLSAKPLILLAFCRYRYHTSLFTIPESTYFAWVDLREVLPEVEDLPDFFANKAGVLLEGGEGLFVGNARGHIRLNLAMPRATVQTGLERIAEAIRKEKAGAQRRG